MKAPPEHRESLWMIAAGPAIWFGHFLLSYVTAAIWCAKIAEFGGPLGGTRIAVGLYTLVALIAIAAVGAHGFRRHIRGDTTVPHDEDTPSDRHRFLGFATLLLSGLSFVATVYVALPVAFIESCR